MKLKLFILSLLFIGSTCTKKELPDQIRYEEDPGASKLTTTQRMEGTWVIADYTFKGSSIYKQLNSIATNTLNLDVAYLKSQQRTKENGWTDIHIFRPWYNGFSFTDTNITFHNGTDTIFCYWFLKPFKYNINTTVSWSITKLYGDNFNIKLRTDSGEYKILWKFKR